MPGGVYDLSHLVLRNNAVSRRFEEMNNRVLHGCNSMQFGLSTRFKLAIMALLVLPGLIISSASAQNPWFEGTRPLIDDGDNILSEKNSWSDTKRLNSPDAIDESKYPPLEEDKTLGTGSYGEPLVDLAPSRDTVPASKDPYQFYDPKALGEVPVYPGSSQQNHAGQYGNLPGPQYRQGYQQGYQHGYQPGYQSGFWPGSSGMGGFPFGGNSGNGFPFGGNNSGFPFGGGNSWMPYSGSGFW